MIRSRLGRGGMGTVYEAENASTGELVAVKTLATHLSDDAGLRRRFMAEIEALRSLGHPGIVRLLAFGEEDGQPYFAMELVRGRSLEQLLRTGRRFSWRETVGVALEIVRALKSAHDHGVIHRDLKPANLLFADEPATGTTVKLADFGIARLFGDTGQTMAGTIVGTAEYMAPEQAAGLPVDQRVDLYALGLVMFAMLTGAPPFRGGTVGEIIERQRREPPPRLASLVAGVPVELDRLIDRLLAKQPADRPANALALGRLLSAIDAAPEPATGPVTHDTPPFPQPRGSSQVDLMADTAALPAVPSRRENPVVIPGAATGRNVAADAATQEMRTAAVRPAATGQGPTVPTIAGSAADRPVRNRYTTVEDLQRAMREQEARDRRRQHVLQAVVVVLTGGLLAAVGYLLFRQPTADELHARIEAVATDDDADLRDARPLIDLFLARHASDPRAAGIRKLDHSLDLDALERRARRRIRSDRVPPPLERDYRAAMAREAESPAACVAALEALLAVHDPKATAGRPPVSAAAAAPGAAPISAPISGQGVDEADPQLWLALARRQIDRLTPLAKQEEREDADRAAATLREAAALAAAAKATADPARSESLRGRRRELLESVVEIYAARPHAAAAVTEARRLLADTPAPESKPQASPEPSSQQ